MHHKRNWISAVLFCAMISAVGFGGPLQKPAEATASVPELTAFHEVIYQIWHEAWPKKNTALLQKLLPDVEKGIASVAAAPLPGILHEKKAAWSKGVVDLQAAGAEYKTAATTNDDAKLLAAAETLHSRFEALTRAIRPALKELDDFHSVLYMLVHHYLPSNQKDKIKSASMELKQKMAALNEAKLPESLQARDHDFQVAKGMLAGAVGALEQSVESNDDAAIKKAIESVHSRYQALEKVFE
jgi:hypothetical protein